MIAMTNATQKQKWQNDDWWNNQNKENINDFNEKDNKIIDEDDEN